MKIYTKTGDTGETSLFGGKRVSKDDLRIEAYGTIDELNSQLGLLITHIKDNNIQALLLKIQHRLFDIGSVLAVDPASGIELPGIELSDIEALENAIDNYNQELNPLKSFILPGGSAANAMAHICRTVCRRAERRVISLSKEAELDIPIIKYLNRLSDYFFVLSRLISHVEGAEEIKWQSR